MRIAITETILDFGFIVILYRTVSSFCQIPRYHTSVSPVVERETLTYYSLFKTPRVGFEPTTNRLTADRSTTELPRIAGNDLLL
jgi:hypothetical protein